MGLHKRTAEQDMVEGKYQGLPQISWCWTVSSALLGNFLEIQLLES